MQFIDYYQVLGLDDKASDDAIKKAYRKLARQYHPDVSKAGDAEEKFKQVSEAYRVLKDPERRREYDELKRYGGQPGEEFRPPPGWHSQQPFNADDLAGAEGIDMSDFFAELFGRRAAGAGFSRPGPQGAGAAGFAAGGGAVDLDQQARLSVSLADAYRGATLPLNLNIPVYHDDGSVTLQQRALQVKLPEGIVSGQRIRLKGQGAHLAGADTHGDLYIRITLLDDPDFHLDGRDVTSSVSIYPWQAMLGARVPVKTLGGTVTLTIPPGSRSGARLRLKGRGLPGKPAGDQHVVLAIRLPSGSNEQQQQAWKALAASYASEQDGETTP